MTLEEFNLLHEYEQEEYVFENGTFLANYVHENEICDVYQVTGFYVKFCYLISSHGRPKITAFTNPSLLEFLDDIDISELT
ncbi:MAG TPA: hypothetical protein VEZ17_01410 [Chitinophagaceae bacterium]|jgi:hypothetical protein|nr:hypothetical protein [Chitinophagaceae bacterium]